MADLTKFYGWGSREAMELTWSDLAWWNAQAVRMVKAESARDRAALSGIAR